MTLQSSGQISILDIVGEFGGTAPHSLTEYYGVDTNIPASGQISIFDFYGASAVPPPLFNPGTSYNSGSDPLEVTFLIIPNSGITYSLSDFSGYFDSIDGVQRALKPISYVQTPPPTPSNVFLYMNIDDSGSMGGGYDAWVQAATRAFLKDVPNGAYVYVQYYWEGVKIDQVMDDTLKSQIDSIIGSYASAGTPLYENILNAVNYTATNAGARSFKVVIAQTDGQNNGIVTYADSASTIVSTASGNSIVLHLFTTGTAGDDNLRNIPNDPALSPNGSTYYESVSQDEQIGSFRGISAKLNYDTGLLKCQISVDSNPASRSLDNTDYPSGLAFGKYTGMITADNGSVTRAQPFSLFV